MLRADPLTIERLLDWLEGRLSSEASQAISAQVAAADETVQADVTWLRAFLRLSDIVVLEDPPPTVHAALVQRFAEQRQNSLPTGTQGVTQGEPSLGFWQRIIATLTFDSHLQPGLAGARGAEQPRTRQLIYNSAVADIALNLYQEANTLTILGQILPTGALAPENCAVQVLRNERSVGLVLADALGEFSFKGLPPGDYQLTVTGDQFDLTIPQLIFES